jgi:hypothetical protein
MENLRNLQFLSPPAREQWGGALASPSTALRRWAPEVSQAFHRGVLRRQDRAGAPPPGPLGARVKNAPGCLVQLNPRIP